MAISIDSSFSRSASFVEEPTTDLVVPKDIYDMTYDYHDFTDPDNATDVERRTKVTDQIDRLVGGLTPEYQDRFVKFFGNDFRLTVRVQDDTPSFTHIVSPSGGAVVVVNPSDFDKPGVFPELFGKIVLALSTDDDKSKIDELFKKKQASGGPWITNEFVPLNSTVENYFTDSVAAFQRGTSGGYDKTWLRRHDPGMWELLNTMFNDQAPVAGPVDPQPEPDAEDAEPDPDRPILDW